jgi:hypothetical protein
LSFVLPIFYELTPFAPSLGRESVRRRAVNKDIILDLISI